MSADPAFTGERPLLPALEAHLEKGEKVRWAARADFRSVLRTKLVLWWIGVPWTIAVIALYFTRWLPNEAFFPLGMVGFAFLAAPFILVFEGDRTIYAITDRRALIVHGGMRHSVVKHSFRDMDEELEVLETGGGAGHVYFASNMSTKMRDTDHTGKLAFRDVANAKKVAEILDRARGKSPA
jgi:hypothetical protein